MPVLGTPPHDAVIDLDYATVAHPVELLNYRRIHGCNPLAADFSLLDQLFERLHEQIGIVWIHLGDTAGCQCNRSEDDRAPHVPS